MALISVIIPTIRGREEHYDRVLAAFVKHGTAPHDMEVVTERDHPTVGCAWQAGAEKATGDYILMGNDDCEPQPGWHLPAIEAVGQHVIPSPLVWTPDGYPQGLPTWGQVAEDWARVSCCLIPFMSRQMWDGIRPLFTGHYHTDNFVTLRAGLLGYPCHLRTGFSFVHHWAQPGRGAGMGSEQGRIAYDTPLYERAVEMVMEGEWWQPWPPEGMFP